jgi:hypothetical protein
MKILDAEYRESTGEDAEKIIYKKSASFRVKKSLLLKYLKGHRTTEMA